MLFSDWTETELRAAIKALEQALARGVMRVSYQGETVDYSSPKEMRQTLGHMRAALAERTTSAPTPPRRISIYADKGWH